MKHEGVIQKTIHWIKLYLHERIIADDFNEVIGFSKYLLHRIFQSSIGMSTSKYIRMRRLTNAANWLLTMEEGMMALVNTFPFKSQASFTFKRLYGLPLGKSRKEIQTDTNMKDWFLSGSHPFHYEISARYTECALRKGIGLFQSK